MLSVLFAQTPSLSFLFTFGSLALHGLSSLGTWTQLKIWRIPCTPGRYNLQLDPEVPFSLRTDTFFIVPPCPNNPPNFKVSRF